MSAKDFVIAPSILSANFAKLAEEKSTGPSGKSGGDLGFVAKGATVRFQAAWLGPEDFDRVCLVLRDGIRGPRCWSGNPPQPANVAPPQLPVQVDERPAAGGWLQSLGRRLVHNR